MLAQDFEFEQTNCPVCNSPQHVPWLILTDCNTGLSGEFPLVCCSECGVAYLNPRPAAASIGRFYPQTYLPHQTPAAEAPAISRWLRKYGLWKRCRVLLRLQKSGRVLDIGCGMGQFMAAMQQHGWKAVGIDQSEQAVQYVTEVLGLEAYAGQLNGLNVPEAAFDAVTMWDSLEHMHSPREALRQTWQLLKPGGYLLLRVPSLDSWDRHIFKANWAGFDAPRHLVSFPRQALMKIVSECGFCIDRVWCMSGGFASFVISCRFALNSSAASSRMKAWRLSLVDNPFTQLLSFPYFFVVDKLQRGSEITLLARKTTERLLERNEAYE